MKNVISNFILQFSKKAVLPLALLAVIFTVGATAQPAQDKGGPPPSGRQFKLVLARRSTADPVEIMKHLSQSCPNITMTTNSKNSDYMLYAGGWSGNYRFMVIGKGGDTLYATETTLLSSAVRDVCKFVNARP
jgi:hypothetical protein